MGEPPRRSVHQQLRWNGCWCGRPNGGSACVHRAACPDRLSPLIQKGPRLPGADGGFYIAKGLWTPSPKANPLVINCLYQQKSHTFRCGFLGTRLTAHSRSAPRCRQRSDHPHPGASREHFPLHIPPSLLSEISIAVQW